MEATAMNLRHLAREVSSALELSLARMASAPLIEQLASATGLLTALVELPLDTDALRVWADQAIARAERALVEWRTWQEKHQVTA